MAFERIYTGRDAQVTLVNLVGLFGVCLVGNTHFFAKPLHFYIRERLFCRGFGLPCDFQTPVQTSYLKTRSVKRSLLCIQGFFRAFQLSAGLNLVFGRCLIQRAACNAILKLEARRFDLLGARCLVSCDHIPRRSWPLFRAKAMLGDLIAGFSSPGIQSHQEQLTA